MKLKAVIHKDHPVSLKEALSNKDFRMYVMQEVLIPHLKVPKNFGPAEFYVQECDLADGDPMCEARLTGVSVTTKRATDDFTNALRVLEEIYVEKLTAYKEEIGKPLQLMVSMMLDKVPQGLESNSSLLELPPRWLFRSS